MLPHKQCRKLPNSFCRFHLTQKKDWTYIFFLYFNLESYSYKVNTLFWSSTRENTRKVTVKGQLFKALYLFTLWMRHQILWCQWEEIKSFSFTIIMDLPVQFNYFSLSVWCFQIYVFLSCFIGLYCKIWKAAWCATHTQLGDCYCWATFLGYTC